MKAEGIITNNDVLRSEMQLTNDRLSKNETENNIRIVSQQLNLLIGLDEHLLLIPDTTLLSQECPTTEYEDYVNRAFQPCLPVRPGLASAPETDGTGRKQHPADTC